MSAKIKIIDNKLFCRKCQETKDVSFFYTSDSRECGYASHCKECESKRHKKEGPKIVRVSKSICFDNETKSCITCNNIFPISKFYKNCERKGGYINECKECNTKRWRKSKFGISDLKFQELLYNQHNKCAICKKEEAVNHRTEDRKRALAVDHCHKTDKIRGLLCTKCNQGLGLFFDNPTFLLTAAEYLKLHQEPILTNKIKELIPLN